MGSGVRPFPPPPSPAPARAGEGNQGSSASLGGGGSASPGLAPWATFLCPFGARESGSRGTAFVPWASCRLHEPKEVTQTSACEVCGLSTMNQEKAADLPNRSALPTPRNYTIRRRPVLSSAAALEGKHCLPSSAAAASEATGKFCTCKWQF